jgi:hypothetical protein
MKSLLFVLVIAVLALPLQAASKQWVHVNVDNPRKSEKVKVNIPVSLMENLMPLVENDKDLKNGRIQIHDRDMNVQDLRKAWKAVREEGDGEYITVEKPDGNFKLYTKGNFLYVDTSGNSKDQVHMMIPMQVVDALFSSNTNELDLMAAVQALKDSGVKDIVTVKSHDSTVRVWVDENNTQSE